MSSKFPRREQPAAKVGPRLEISPLELQSVLQEEHGLSSALRTAKSWEPFAWKGNELSAPLRALYAAESGGLLSRRGDRAVSVAIPDITADINAYLAELGKPPISENTVLNNLRQVSLYVNAALGVAVVPDRAAMSVRFADGHETADSIERYFDQIKTKLQKLGSQLKHAEACGYDVSRVLAQSEEHTGVRLLVAA
jgi:hypothetical protein